MLVDLFIDLSISSNQFFSFKNEGEILTVLGNKVKALGLRKNLMRIIRKLRTLEEKLLQIKQKEEQQRILIEQQHKLELQNQADK